MEYAILDQLVEQSENNKERYFDKNPQANDVKSGVESQSEAFAGSSDTLQLYIFKNYFGKAGPVDLAIIIRETPATGGFGDFKLSNVEVAVFPLYSANGEGNAFDIPLSLEVLPSLTKEQEEFIFEKRRLPKKPYGGEFDPAIHRWSCDRIAEELGVSNRKVGRFVRVKGL